MADTKISALTALAGADVDTSVDVIPIVDTGSTTTKKITVAELKTALAVPSSVVLPRSYLAGLTLSNNGSDATNDIDIAAGVCKDSTNAVDITCAAMTKQLDAGWAAGTNQGMRNSGAAITNTTYHIYAVSKADGTQDYYAHTSTTVSTVITALQAESGGASYLYARRIGSILREGGAIVGFVQDGDDFYRKVPIADVNTAPSSTSAVTRTLSVPIGVRVKAHIAVIVYSDDTVSGAPAVAYISDLSTTDTAAASTLGFGGTGLTATDGAGAYVQVWTNTSGQVRSRMSNADVNAYLAISTLGWMDLRGKAS